MELESLYWRATCWYHEGYAMLCEWFSWIVFTQIFISSISCLLKETPYWLTLCCVLFYIYISCSTRITWEIKVHLNLIGNIFYIIWLTKELIYSIIKLTVLGRQKRLMWKWNLIILPNLAEYLTSGLWCLCHLCVCLWQLRFVKDDQYFQQTVHNFNT